MAAFRSATFLGWRERVMEAGARFPLALLSSAVATAACIALTRTHGGSGEDFLTRVAMTATLGLPLFFALRMLLEQTTHGRSWLMELPGVGVLTGWFLFFQPKSLSEAGNVALIRWLLFLAALHFFAAFSAFLWRREGQVFWQFNRRLFLRFCLTTLYSGVLTLGLELALLSADKLFELKLNNSYPDLFLFMAGVFHPAFFLGGIPPHLDALESGEEYPRGLKAFTQFALAPLAAVYTCLLYLYAGKILLQRAWPHGWVALPVLLLAGVGIFTFLLLAPLRQRTEEKWAAWYTRNFPRLLAPLSLLLLLSVWRRVSDYGITEPRYLGLVAGLWILLWSIVFTLRTGTGIRWVPASLAVICLLAAFGPWNAFNVSRRNQLSRLRSILAAHGLLRDGEAAIPDRPVELSAAEHTDLLETLQYLIRAHGARTVSPLFASVLKGTKLTEKGGSNARDKIISALRILPREESDSASLVRDGHGGLDVRGFSSICYLEVRKYSGAPIAECNDARITIEGGQLKFWTLSAPSPQIIPIAGREGPYPAGEQRVPDRELTVDFTHGNRSFRIVFQRVNRHREAQGMTVIYAPLFLLER